MVGPYGLIRRDSGLGWVTLSENTLVNFNDVWGSGQGEVWVVGEYGAIMELSVRSLL